MEKDEKKKADNRERVHKSRLNQRFEKQIDENFQPVEREILRESIKDLYNTVPGW